MPVDRDTLGTYYKRIFPCNEIYKWLSYGNQETFRRREVSFATGDIVRRFVSFSSADALRAELVRAVPDKMDFGAVFSHPPDKKGGITLVPMQRELVFDVDVSDYDNVRGCCTEKTICSHCWTLMAGAVKTISAMLVNDFGFENFFWVYSGRRGVHCWVCDEEARNLTDEQRTAVVHYLSVYDGGKDGMNINVEKDLCRGNWLHPSIRASLEGTLFDTFAATYYNTDNNNDVRTNEKTRQTLIGYLQTVLRKDTDKNGGVLLDAVAKVDSFADLVATARKLGVMWALECAVLAMTYPRLDVNVSKMRNHLLKSPWVVHPGTGRVCIPLSPDSVDTFDPNADAPLVDELVGALERGEPVDITPWLAPMQCVLSSEPNPQ